MRAGYVRGVYSSAEVRSILHAFDDASCGEVVFNVRPQKNRLLERLIGKLVPGDTLMVWTLECAAPTSESLIQLILELNRKQIGFESISEGFAVSKDSNVSPSTIASRLERVRSDPPSRGDQRSGRRWTPLATAQNAAVRGLLAIITG
jgi:hypothetical protein